MNASHWLTFFQPKLTYLSLENTNTYSTYISHNYKTNYVGRVLTHIHVFRIMTEVERIQPFKQSQIRKKCSPIQNT